jgi:hypothetical protein
VNRRVILLGALAIVLGFIWLEFSVASPWHRALRIYASDTYEAFRIRRLRAAWKPPCDTNEWQWVNLDNVRVPVPACFEYEVAGSSLITYDSDSPDTYLGLSVAIIAAERLSRVRAVPFERNYTVVRDDVVLVWYRFPWSRNVLTGNQMFFVNFYTPEYLAEPERAISYKRLESIMDELIRTISQDASPANKPLNPTVGPVTVAAARDQDGRNQVAGATTAPVLPRGLSATR